MLRDYVSLSAWKVKDSVETFKALEITRDACFKDILCFHVIKNIT